MSGMELRLHNMDEQFSITFSGPVVTEDNAIDASAFRLKSSK